LNIEGVQFLKSEKMYDVRGSFRKVFVDSNGEIDFHLKETFYSESGAGVFRGMHLQTGCSESGRIISLLKGEITDLLIDLRESSGTFKNLIEFDWDSNSDIGAMYVPPGVAHGFLAHTDALMMYQSDNLYIAELDSGVNIQSLSAKLIENITIMSERDAALPYLAAWDRSSK